MGELLLVVSKLRKGDRNWHKLMTAIW